MRVWPRTQTPRRARRWRAERVGAMTRVGIGVIGMGWMRGVHSRAYRQIPDRFYDRGIDAPLVACADSVGARAEAARARFGFARATTDWRAVVDAPDVDAV